jgi:uncharacterized membrane protein YkgB
VRDQASGPPVLRQVVGVVLFLIGMLVFVGVLPPEHGVVGGGFIVAAAGLFV